MKILSNKRYKKLIDTEHQYNLLTGKEFTIEEVKKSYGLSKSKELKEENDRLSQMNRNYIDKLSSRQQEINVLNQRINAADTELRKKQIDLDVANENIKNIKSDKKKLEEELELSHKVNAQLRETISELESQIKVKDIELEAYKNAISNISFTFNNDGKINPKDFDISSITSHENKNKKEKKSIDF